MVGQGTPGTQTVRALRSFVLPMHKKPFIDKILKRIRDDVSRSNRRDDYGDLVVPKFAISRGKVLSGAACAPDGSDSIAFQIFQALKSKGAHNDDGAYIGKSQWWQVTFKGEGGEDAGGLFRESVVDIASDLMSDRTPLFTQVQNHDLHVGTLQDAYIPNPSCTNFDVYEWVGRLCGAAILSDETLGLKFPPLVWKLLADAPVFVDDLREIDLLYVQNYVDIVKEWNDPGVKCTVPMTPEILNSLYLSFTTTLSNGKEVNLVPGGDMCDVTWENRFEYSELASQARLHESDAQIAAMRRGLTSMIPAPLIRMWSAAEFEHAVCGSPEIPVEELRKTCKYVGLNRNSPEVKYLFEALETFSNEDKSLFLRFVTGRARLPAPITVQASHLGECRRKVLESTDSCGTSLCQPFRPPAEAVCQRSLTAAPRGVAGPESFPLSHTCFNQIDIPQYKSVAIATEKILFAIRNTRSIDTDFNPRNEDF